MVKRRWVAMALIAAVALTFGPGTLIPAQASSVTIRTTVVASGSATCSFAPSGCDVVYELSGAALGPSPVGIPTGCVNISVLPCPPSAGVDILISPGLTPQNCEVGLIDESGNQLEADGPCSVPMTSSSPPMWGGSISGVFPIKFGLGTYRSLAGQNLRLTGTVTPMVPYPPASPEELVLSTVGAVIEGQVAAPV